MPQENYTLANFQRNMMAISLWVLAGYRWLVKIVMFTKRIMCRDGYRLKGATQAQWGNHRWTTVWSQDTGRLGEEVLQNASEMCSYRSSHYAVVEVTGLASSFLAKDVLLAYSIRKQQAWVSTERVISWQKLPRAKTEKKTDLERNEYLTSPFRTVNSLSYFIFRCPCNLLFIILNYPYEDNPHT